MTYVQIAIHDSLVMLANAVNGLDDEMYIKSLRSLSGSSIGQHVRHIIDMFQCLHTGYEAGLVNYTKRSRDPKIETNRDFTKKVLYLVNSNIYKPDKDIVVEAIYSANATSPEFFYTNHHRELAYLLEHAIHHMALIRIGIQELSDIKLPKEFGVAYSTFLQNQLQNQK